MIFFGWLNAIASLALVLNFLACGVEGEDFHGIIETRVLWPKPVKPSPCNFAGTSSNTRIANNGKERRIGPYRKQTERLYLVEIAKTGLILDKAANLLVDHILGMSNQVYIPTKFAMLGEKLNES